MDDIFRNNLAARRALLEALHMQPTPPTPPPQQPHKPCQAYSMLCENPGKWFRGAIIDDRDRALLTGERAPFVEYSKVSYLRKIYHQKTGENFKETQWIVETDDECKKLVGSAGAQLYGFDFAPAIPVSWASMTVNVNIEGSSGAGFIWGYLSTRPSNIRIFKGPQDTCELHPWDAMILRDCTPNTGSLYALDNISSRKWDILVMKMCEDYNHPWVVVSVKDAGPAEPVTSGQCCC